MKRVLITGASSGVGAACARHFARAGDRVLLLARSADRLAALAGEIGPQAVALPCDAADPEAVAAVAEEVRARHGVPDVIVNSAGAGAWKTVPDTTPQEAVAMMGAPYFAAFNVTHAFLAEMLARGSGVIVQINSPACIAAWPRSAGYAAARAALLGFHRALAQDLVGTGVTSCHVIFGRIDTGYFSTNAVAEEALPLLGRLVPTLTAEDCAQVVAELARRPRAYAIHPWHLRPLVGTAMLLPRLSARMLRY